MPEGQYLTIDHYCAEVWLVCYEVACSRLCMEYGKRHYMFGYRFDLVKVFETEGNHDQQI